MRPTGGMSSPVPVGKPTVVLCVGPTDVPWLSTRAAGSLKGDVPQRLFLPSRTGCLAPSGLSDTQGVDNWAGSIRDHAGIQVFPEAEPSS